MNKEWFWILNGDTFKSFSGFKLNKLNINISHDVGTNDTIEKHKNKFIENYLVLKTICYFYGFKKWSNTRKRSESRSINNSLSSSPETNIQLN